MTTPSSPHSWVVRLCGAAAAAAAAYYLVLPALSRRKLAGLIAESVALHGDGDFDGTAT